MNNKIFGLNIKNNISLGSLTTKSNNNNDYRQTIVL